MATQLIKPQVLVFQEFRTVPAEIVQPLRAHISGPNAKLHRYSVAAEKALIGVGEYDPNDDVAVVWPGRTAGGLVDAASVRVFIDDAKLLYFTDAISAGSVISPVSGKKNRVTSDTIAFKTNGDNSRSAVLGDRDVEIGDLVYLRGVSGEDCVELSLWTHVAGFVANTIDPVIHDATSDTGNLADTAAAATIEQSDGVENAITATTSGAAYSGLPSGHASETYTLEVVASSIEGCSAAKIRVISASGTDNVEELTPEAFGTPTNIGERGLTVTFARAVGSTDVLTIGQTWTVEVSQAYDKAAAVAGTVYTGAHDDTYIVEVTKGGLWADLPQVSVTTAKGLDKSGPSTVSAGNVAVPVGTSGLTVKFMDDSAIGVAASSGLNKGDKFYVAVETGQDGPIRTLILRDDMPLEMRAADDLDLKLFIKADIEITKNRLSDPPNLNFELETTQVILKAGATAYNTTWTNGGVEQALTIQGGRVLVEYREFLPALADAVNFINDVADLEKIPGQLDEQNPLKWGVYKALQNSGGTQVGYTAVADPSSLDSWQVVTDRIQGRDDIYNLVPLSHTREVLNLFQAHVGNESGPETGNWKAMFANLLGKSQKMLVGLSDADGQSLRPTSTDGEVVLATLEDDPDASSTQYTILSVPENNSGFLTYGVRAGDIVRYLFSIDAFGDASYDEFVVDAVLSENTLRLQAGHGSAITVAQKLEIWRTLTKPEIVADLQDQAQGYADRRVVATWPDLVGTAGNAQAGYFMNAALAGLVSASAPHRPLTNVSVSGFDDAAARTRDFFSASQLAELASSGIWIVTEDRDGTVHTYHALTSDTTDLNGREESIRRNVDAMSYLFLSRLKPFIGRSNVSDAMVDKLRYELTRVMRTLKASNLNAEIGSQLLAGSIRVLRQHPLLADRIEAVLDLVVPAPLNNIELHLVV